MKILTSLYVLMLTGAGSVLAQSDQEDFQSWFDFWTFYIIDENWTYDGDYGTRGFLSDENWRRAYVNPAFLYQATIDIDLRGGLRLVFTREEDTSNTIEIRPWQGVRFRWPKTNFIIFSQYIRLEERFTYGTEVGSFNFE